MTVLVPAAALRAVNRSCWRCRWPCWLWTYLTNVYLAPETSFSIPYVSHFWSLAIENTSPRLAIPHWSLATRPAMRACLVTGLGALALRSTTM